ncbi:hypothetical protein F5146DRAFT_293102 [Armillaria mellea]|nr:hypothetical protein F5146DRAFT_747067 [Armillaria mellea]KAK0195549.1 hypothetical protein F5146DRAFT_293102 [Armillaria mellea]
MLLHLWAFGFGITFCTSSLVRCYGFPNINFLCRGIRGGTPLQMEHSKLAFILFGCAVLLAIIVFSAAKFDINNEVVL